MWAITQDLVGTLLWVWIYHKRFLFSFRQKETAHPFQDVFEVGLQI
jgi:hypothetical protein